MEMCLRQIKKHGNNSVVNFKQHILSECSLRCSLEANEEESCDSTRYKRRLKKSEPACYEDTEKGIKCKRSR